MCFFTDKFKVNDVIGKSAKAGMELLEKKYDITDDKFEEIVSVLKILKGK